MVDTVQVIYNIFDQSPDDQLFPLCQKENVGIIVRVPLDEGSLTGKLTLETKFDENDFRNEYFNPKILPEVIQKVKNIEPILKSNATSMAVGALQFALSPHAVSTVICGIRNPEQAKENCSASHEKSLTTETLALLKKHRWIR